MLPECISAFPLIGFYKEAGKSDIFLYELMAMKIERSFLVSSLIRSNFLNIFINPPHNFVVCSSTVLPSGSPFLQASGAHLLSFWQC
jgi:hypothetical protein